MRTNPLAPALRASLMYSSRSKVVRIMYRHLIERLADEFHLIAPDHPRACARYGTAEEEQWFDVLELENTRPRRRGRSLDHRGARCRRSHDPRPVRPHGAGTRDPAPLGVGTVEPAHRRTPLRLGTDSPRPRSHGLPQARCLLARTGNAPRAGSQVRLAARRRPIEVCLPMRPPRPLGLKLCRIHTIRRIVNPMPPE